MNEQLDYTPEESSHEAFLEPEVVLRFTQFEEALTRFSGNFNSWLANSRTLSENPEINNSVTQAGNLILSQSTQLLQLYRDGAVTNETSLAHIDELVLTMDQLSTVVHDLIETRNEQLYQSANHSAERLSGIQALQFQAIFLIHETFQAIRENFRFSVMPFDSFGVLGSVSLNDILSINDESMIQSGLDDPVIRTTLEYIGIENIDDFNAIKNKEFTLSDIPAVTALVALRIPEEAAELGDFVLDLLEAGSMMPVFEMGSQTELLQSNEMQLIRDQNQVINLISLSSHIPDFLSQLSFDSEQIQEAQSLISELMSSIGTPSELTVGELSDYISILISLVVVFLTAGSAVPAKAAQFAARSAQLAMGATSARSAQLWARASRLLSRISSSTSSLAGLRVPPVLNQINQSLSGMPGLSAVNPRIAGAIESTDIVSEVLTDN